MAIPVRIAAKDVRFSAKISCASLIIIESLLGVWLAKSHTFLVDKFLYPKAKVRGAGSRSEQIGALSRGVTPDRQVQGQRCAAIGPKMSIAKGPPAECHRECNNVPKKGTKSVPPLKGKSW
jgi:hypothetical protein